jgi:hypothetical protein
MWSFKSLRFYPQEPIAFMFEIFYLIFTLGTGNVYSIPSREERTNPGITQGKKDV